MSAAPTPPDTSIPLGYLLSIIGIGIGLIGNLVKSLVDVARLQLQTKQLGSQINKVETRIEALPALDERIKQLTTLAEKHDAACASTSALVQHVETLAERLSEDRRKNNEQHEDFYEHRRNSEQMQAEITQQMVSFVSTQERILKQLDDIAIELRTIPKKAV